MIVLYFNMIQNRENNVDGLGGSNAVVSLNEYLTIDYKWDL